MKQLKYKSKIRLWFEKTFIKNTLKIVTVTCDKCNNEYYEVLNKDDVISGRCQYCIGGMIC